MVSDLILISHAKIKKRDSVFGTISFLFISILWLLSKLCIYLLVIISFLNSITDPID